MKPWLILAAVILGLLVTAVVISNQEQVMVAACAVRQSSVQGDTRPSDKRTPEMVVDGRQASRPRQQRGSKAGRVVFDGINRDLGERLEAGKLARGGVPAGTQEPPGDRRGSSETAG